LAEEIQRLINIDTSVLIEYFRKSEKSNSFFVRLLNKKFQGFLVSVAVHFEIYQGINNLQVNYWDNLFSDFLLLPYNENVNKHSIEVYKQLKKKRRSIEFKDLMIAATAKANKYPLATLNKRHFDQIEGLDLITPDDL
jgi:tRNA(fMet)-specific endonuclease VapC